MKNLIKFSSILLIVCLLAFLLVSCAPQDPISVENPYLAKNIILMIGDGMGSEHLEATKIYYGLDSLNMEQLSVSGVVNTMALLGGVEVLTDSGAAATAMATGYKTRLTMIGMAPAPGLSIIEELALTPITHTNVTEIAISSGRKTGIVATKNLNDATPAAFSSHVLTRSMLEDVTTQQIASGVDVLMGAGYSEYYLPKIDAITGAGYQVITTKTELMYANGDKVYAGFDSITPSSEVNLELMVQKALELLHNDDGFFAMFEGSKIDSGSHSNDMLSMVKETLSFDIAVGIAMNYVRLNPDTLLIVTADHETGGLDVPPGTTKEQLSNNMFSVGGHTIAMVPYFIWGPGINSLEEQIDNTDIAKIIARAMGTSIH